MKWTRNGGIELGFLELADQDGLLTPRDKERKEFLENVNKKNTHVLWFDDQPVTDPNEQEKIYKQIMQERGES